MTKKLKPDSISKGVDMQKHFQILVLVATLILTIQSIHAKTAVVSSLHEYNQKVAGLDSGDTIRWKNGTYKDIHWIIDEDELIILAETSGGVIFTGASQLDLKADNVTVSGFQFLNGNVSGSVFVVSGNHNRIENINIDNYRSHYYFHITTGGRHNVVQKCNFENKPVALEKKEGTSIFQVAVDSIQPGYNVIRYCSFKNHSAPENAGGDYGMEALRIGYSFQAEFISRTTVEYCYFYKCKGDGEIISNKARENVFRYNTFTGNDESHFTLRHGSDNVIYSNFFLDGAGIRIKEGQNQAVYNNYFNTGDYFAIRLENYRVDPLDNITIAHNTFAQSGRIQFGQKGEYPPENVYVLNNIFFRPAAEAVVDCTGREVFRNNGYYSASGMEKGNGFFPMKNELELNAFNFYEPNAEASTGVMRFMFSPVYDVPELDDDPNVLYDISKNRRPAKLKFIGCYEPGKEAVPLNLYATAENTGPAYLSSANGLHSVAGFKEVIYKKVDTTALSMLIKYPEGITEDKTYPVIVFFFGGGWNGGSMEQFIPHARYFASRGMIAAIADYRVKSRHQTTPFDAVADAKSAIRYLRKYSQSLQVDTSRIAASGGSAGGHLAAAAATVAGLNDSNDDLKLSARPNALVLFNPVFDNGPEGYGYERIGERYPEISPIHNIRQGNPPTIVFLGTNDRLIPVETAEKYKRLMEEAGNRCDLFLYEGQGHGFFNYRESSPDGNFYYNETVLEANRFLKSLGFIE